MIADVISQSINDRNQKTTHESNHWVETVPYINDMNKIPQGTFPITLNITDWYQGKNPGITAKLEWATYKCGSFNLGSNNIFKLIMFKGKILLC